MPSKVAIRQLVDGLLKAHKIQSAPVNVEEIAKSEGAVIEYHPLKEGVSGFSFSDGSQQTIGINVQESDVRQRFTMAHELGHLKLGAKGLNYDRSPGLQFRDTVSSTGQQQKEIDANFFAAELLMPAKLLEFDLKQALDEATTPDAEQIAQTLAERYNVSSQAMNVRLTSLGFFSMPATS